MTLRNFDGPVLDIYGEERKRQGKDKNGNPEMVTFRLRDMIVNALAETHKGDESMSYEDKLARWDLAEKIVKGGNVDLSVKELLLIREYAQKSLGPSGIGPLNKALEHDIIIEPTASA